MKRVFDWQKGRNVDRPENEFLRDVKKISKRSRLEDDFAAELKLYGLPTPERQYKFHPTRKWRADFAWPQFKIIVEISGGLYVTGRHNRGAQMEQEYEKFNSAQAMGYRVFLFGPKACRVKKRTTESSLALKFMYEVFHAR